MFKRIELFSCLAAAAALAACGETRTDAPAADTAAANGVAVASIAEPDITAQPAATAQSALAPQPAVTGGLCGGDDNKRCAAAGDFCKTATNQCATVDADGTCTKRPEVCTAEHAPVCGCDGKTYGNACKADMAGVNVQATGACPE